MINPEDGIAPLVQAAKLIDLLCHNSGEPCDGFRFREGIQEMRKALTVLHGGKRWDLIE